MSQTPNSAPQPDQSNTKLIAAAGALVIAAGGAAAFIEAGPDHAPANEGTAYANSAPLEPATGSAITHKDGPLNPHSTLTAKNGVISRNPETNSPIDSETAPTNSPSNNSPKTPGTTPDKKPANGPKTPQKPQTETTPDKPSKHKPEGTTPDDPNEDGEDPGDYGPAGPEATPANRTPSEAVFAESIDRGDPQQVVQANVKFSAPHGKVIGANSPIIKYDAAAKSLMFAVENDYSEDFVQIYSETGDDAISKIQISKIDNNDDFPSFVEPAGLIDPSDETEGAFTDDNGYNFGSAIYDQKAFTSYNIGRFQILDDQPTIQALVGDAPVPPLYPPATVPNDPSTGAPSSPEAPSTTPDYGGADFEKAFSDFENPALPKMLAQNVLVKLENGKGDPSWAENPLIFEGQNGGVTIGYAAVPGGKGEMNVNHYPSLESVPFFTDPDAPEGSKPSIGQTSGEVSLVDTDDTDPEDYSQFTDETGAVFGSFLKKVTDEPITALKLQKTPDGQFEFVNDTTPQGR